MSPTPSDKPMRPCIYCIYNYIFLDSLNDQERMGKETLAEDSESELDARQGGLTNVTEIAALYSSVISRLIGKTEQLLAMLPLT